MNIIADETSYKCNIFQIMILQLHIIGGNRGGLDAPSVRWKVWQIRSQFHLTKHSTHIWSNQTAIKSMALLDHNDWGKGRLLESSI